MSVRVVGIPGSLREGSFNKGFCAPPSSWRRRAWKFGCSLVLETFHRTTPTLMTKAIRSRCRRLILPFAKRMRC